LVKPLQSILRCFTRVWQAGLLKTAPKYAVAIVVKDKMEELFDQISLAATRYGRWPTRMRTQ
jgi:hypothetical protein